MKYFPFDKLTLLNGNIIEPEKAAKAQQPSLQTLPRCWPCLGDSPATPGGSPGTPRTRVTPRDSGMLAAPACIWWEQGRGECARTQCEQSDAAETKLGEKKGACRQLRVVPSRKMCTMHHVLQLRCVCTGGSSAGTGGWARRKNAHREHTRGPACTQPGMRGGTGLCSHATCKALIYLDWNNLSVAVILTTSVLRSQSGAVLIKAFMSSHKSSKMKTQGPLKYTPRVCAVQLEAFMTPVRAFMTL